MSRKEGVLANEEAQDAQRKREKVAREQVDADLVWLLSQPQGRRFFYGLIYKVCGVEDGIWQASAEIHYREGRRSVGIEVKNEAQRVAPLSYLKMVQEQMEAAQKRLLNKETD